MSKYHELITQEEFAELYEDQIPHMSIHYWKEYDHDRLCDHPLFRVWQGMKQRAQEEGLEIYRPWEEDCREFFKYCDLTMPERGPREGVYPIDRNVGFYPGCIVFRHHRSNNG